MPRVAAVATLVVMVFYVIAAIVLNLIVTNHLISATDHRLADRLEDARGNRRSNCMDRARRTTAPTSTMHRYSCGRSHPRRQ